MLSLVEKSLLFRHLDQFASGGVSKDRRHDQHEIFVLPGSTFKKYKNIQHDVFKYCSFYSALKWLEDNWGKTLKVKPHSSKPVSQPSTPFRSYFRFFFSHKRTALLSWTQLPLNISNFACKTSNCALITHSPFWYGSFWETRGPLWLWTEHWALQCLTGLKRNYGDKAVSFMALFLIWPWVPSAQKNDK